MSEAVIAQKGPYQVELRRAKAYFWFLLVLGSLVQAAVLLRSQQGSRLEPMRFVAESSGIFNICGCKETDDAPTATVPTTCSEDPGAWHRGAGCSVT